VFIDRVLVHREIDRDVYLVRAVYADVAPFESWEGSALELLDHALYQGSGPEVYKVFGAAYPTLTSTEQRQELAALVARGEVVARVVERAVLVLRQRDGEVVVVDDEQPVEGPRHLLDIVEDDTPTVDVGETVEITAHGTPSGTYAWSITGGSGTIVQGASAPTVRVRADGPGTIALRVRHDWAGDILTRSASIRAVDYTWRWDAPHNADREQYVNLPAAWDPPNNGREVELVGHIEPRAAGKTVTFNTVPDPTNEPDVVSTTADATLAAVTATTDAQGVAKVKLTLPWYGGAKFKVGGKTQWMPQPALSGRVTVWRKVFYQATEMTSSPAPENLSLAAPADMISALRGAFEPVFFKLEPGVKSHDTTPYQAHLTAAQRTALEGTLRPTAQDARSPFKMNIVTIDRADIVAEQEWASPATTATVQTPWFQKWGYEPTVIYAQYQPPGTPPGPWTNLTGVTIVANPANAAQEAVRATIPGFAPGSTVNVRIKYRYQRGNAGGWGGTTGTLFMCIGRQRRGNAASPTGAELQQALTHEIGHALGLVPPGAAWHDPDPRDAGYSLRHCKYQNAATPSEPRCVMWFMLGGSGPRLRFCNSDRPDDCSHFLYRTDYASLSWI